MTTPKRPGSAVIPREMDEHEESAAERALRVRRLRWAVQAGAYDADPAVLAALMLCGPRAVFGSGRAQVRQ